MLMQAYLASSSSEEEGPARDPSKYQALLSQAAGRQRAGGKAWGPADESADESAEDGADDAAQPQVCPWMLACVDRCCAGMCVGLCQTSDSWLEVGSGKSSGCR